MELIDQVTNLELSKKLKELGVKQESMFSWVRPDNRNEFVCWYYRELTDPVTKDWEDISAFTVAELGNILPKRLSYKDKVLPIKIYFDETIWVVGYGGLTDNFEIFSESMSEANARAKMLMYLIEEKLITL